MRCPKCGTLVSPERSRCVCGAFLTETSPGHDALDLIGQVLDGRYRLKTLLGIGGNGAVYRAEVEKLGHSVAVKVLHPALMQDTTARRRLENEARLASQIDHPNIVSIIDFRSSAEITYLVMEYLTGVALAEVLYEIGHLGVRRTIHIARQILSALHASHHVKVLHRDLKPENIYLIARQDDLDFVKVLDFGMATATERDEDARITAAGRICGTPAYMSPEQVRNRTLTPQSDLYAVGLLMYECLTGKNPFLADGASATMVNQVTVEPSAPSKFCKEADIPPYLDAVVMRALRKEPSERFASAEEFRWVLEGLVLAQDKNRSDGVQALQTCGECGKLNIAGARHCDACGSPLADDKLIKREAMAPDMIHALEASTTADRDYEIAPTTTTVTTYRPGGWSPSLVGRERELAEIEELFAFGPPPFAQRFIRIIGPPGCGKARFAREVVLRQSQPQGTVVWTEAELLPGFASLFAVQRTVGRLLDLEPGVSRALLFEAAERAGFDMAHRVGLTELFGIPEDKKSPTAKRRVARAEAFREVVRCVNRRRPLTLVFQDMHLYDSPSQELVAALVSAEPCDHPLVVVATHEPELFLLWGETTTVTLPPLPRQEATELAEDLISHIDARIEPAPLVAMSGGNPLMLIELCRLAATTQSLGRLSSLAEVIARRISGLPQRSRMMLHAMAVLGRPTSSNTIVSMMQSELEKEEQALRFLGNLGFLTMRDSGWRLNHRLHREVAYASTPAAIRQSLHAEAARAAVGQQAPAAYTAHHLYAAGQREEAIPYLLRGGRRALRSLDDRLAADLFTRTLKLLPQPPERYDGQTKPWLQATVGLSLALYDGGDYAAALRLLRRGAQMAGLAGWIDESQHCEEQAERLRQDHVA
jgi:serine/threonine protein kinase